MFALIDFDPDQVAHELSKRGLAWVEADSQFKAFDDATKSILSRLAGEQDGSEAAKERSARASEQFKEHLQNLADARFKAAASRVNYDVYRIWIDMKRSELSYHKAEMGMR